MRTPEVERVSGEPQRAPVVGESVPVVGGAYAYYVLGVLFVVYVFNFIDRQLLAILLQPIKEDLQVSDTAMGFLSGFAFAVFYTFAGLPLARVADRWVRRSLIALSLATWSVMTAVSGLARGFPDLALARIGVGIGEAGCTPPAHSLLCDYFPPAKRATVLSLYAIGVYVGVGIGFWLGGWIHDAFGWRTAFFVLGLPGVALALLVRLTVWEPPRGLSERHVVSDRDYQIRETRRFLAALPTASRIGLAAAFHAFASYGLGAWIPTFFVRIHHLTPGELGQWLSWILALGGAIGAFSGGWLADRWGRRDPRARVYISLIGVVLTTPFLALSLLVSDAQLALLSYLPATIFGTLWLGPSGAVVQDLVPPAMRAMASAVFIFILTIIGMGLGPQAVGLLNDWLGTPDAIRYSLLWTAVVMNVISAVYFWLAAKTLVQDLEAKKRL
jgi:MFS family permease